MSVTVTYQCLCGVKLTASANTGSAYLDGVAANQTLSSATASHARFCPNTKQPRTTAAETRDTEPRKP